MKKTTATPAKAKSTSKAKSASKGRAKVVRMKSTAEETPATEAAPIEEVKAPKAEKVAKAPKAEKAAKEPKAPKTEINIISALYGVEGTTVEVKDQMKIGRKITNKLTGNDPAPKVKKQLQVVAEINGERIERTFAEGEILKF
jgi:hypothetical protein